MVNTRRPRSSHQDAIRQAPILSARNPHVVEEILPRTHSEPEREVNSPQVVTRRDLDQLAAQINRNLEESLRALINQGVGQDKQGSAPQPNPPPHVSHIHQVSSRPQTSRRSQPDQSHDPQRETRQPSRPRDAREIINDRRLKDGTLDAREIINSKRENFKEDNNLPQRGRTRVHSRHGSTRYRDSMIHSATSRPRRGADQPARSVSKSPERPSSPRPRRLGIVKNITPFSQEIMNTSIPPKVKIPTLDPYDGKTDPTDHLNAYKAQMGVQKPGVKLHGAGSSLLHSRA